MKSYSIKPADRLESVSEYYFSRKLKEVAQMNAEGKNVISLGIGSPDMPPSEATIKALCENAMLPDVHGYQPTTGTPELRKAFAEWYKKWYDVELNPDTEIQPLIGSKEGILHVTLAFVNVGDAVLVPNPGYPTYTSLSKLLGAEIINYNLKEENGWMPDFEELIAMQTGGAGWERSGRSNASAGLSVRSTADLNNYRGLLSQASRQAGLAGSRLESLFGLVRNVGKPGNAAGNGKGNGNGGGAGGGTGDGGGGGDGGLGGVNYENNEVMTPYSKYRGPRLNESMVKAQALPGRRFSKDAERKGWLYVNTWYMIGPWENYGRDDFAIIHQPEISVDFDAVYTDGQVGVGIEETESDPIKMIGKEVKLDGTLRWKFMQSESMHNTVPVTTGHSTYYAYTELYFDEATTMLVAIGTDDSGRIWINGKDVWQDKGTSWYHIDEHIEPFTFQQGWNRVLLRLENGGGGAAGFSFLIIPQDHAVTTD